MVAYEGVRANAIQSPFASVPTALMRQGNFSQVTTPIREPAHGAAVPGQHHPGQSSSPRPRSSSSSTIRTPTFRATPTTSRARARSTTTSTSFSVRVDQNLGNKVRLSLRYNWHDSYTENSPPANAPIPITAMIQPRTNKNWLFGYTHTLTVEPPTTISGSATTASTSTR